MITKTLLHFFSFVFTPISIGFIIRYITSISCSIDREGAPDEIMNTQFFQFCQHGGHTMKCSADSVVCKICSSLNILYKMNQDIERTERRRFLLYSDVANIILFRKSIELL